MDPDLVTLKSLKTRLVPFQHLSKSSSHNMIINHIPARVTYKLFFYLETAQKQGDLLQYFISP